MMRKYNDRVDDEIWKAYKLFNRWFLCHLAVILSKNESTVNLTGARAPLRVLPVKLADP